MAVSLVIQNKRFITIHIFDTHRNQSLKFWLTISLGNLLRRLRWRALQMINITTKRFVVWILLFSYGWFCSWVLFLNSNKFIFFATCLPIESRPGDGWRGEEYPLLKVWTHRRVQTLYSAWLKSSWVLLLTLNISSV